jgi:hypothetical protein
MNDQTIRRVMRELGKRGGKKRAKLSKGELSEIAKKGWAVRRSKLAAILTEAEK